MLNTLFATDVRQTLDQFRRSVDQLFENFYGYQHQPAATPAWGERTFAFTPPLEYGWGDTYLNLRAVMPGVNDKDVRVTVHNSQLIIEGERKAPEWFAKNAYTHLAYGKFYAAFTLPAGLDVDHINCKLHNGVMDIQVPIVEASKPKQVPIQTAPAKAVSA
jgi:HSP20 family protein